jgi:hypothetical protein
MLNNAGTARQLSCTFSPRGATSLDYPTSDEHLADHCPSSQLERLAVARLQHTVNELQIKVENDRNLQPPVRNIFHCVVDESSLTAHIPEFKHWVGEASIKMIVPLAGKISLFCLY